jgi:DNA-binding transcriptional MerR regulator
MEDLLSIGEFAAASRLSQRALRLYGENGLLPRAWVDPDSGYRYYRLGQLREATIIGLLRRSGMPLVEIRSFLRDPTTRKIDDYGRRIAAELDDRLQVLRQLKRVLEEETMYEVRTRQAGRQTYVSRSRRVRANELEGYIFETFADLGEADGAHPFVLYHGAVNAEEDGPVEVCVPKSDGNQSLPAAELAFTEITGSLCDFPEILGAYEAVYRWAKENGREPGGPPREIYLSQPGEALRMEIALPLR